MTATICKACGTNEATDGFCSHCDQPCRIGKACAACKQLDRYLGTGPRSTGPMSSA